MNFDKESKSVFFFWGGGGGGGGGGGMGGMGQGGYKDIRHIVVSSPTILYSLM